MSFDENWLVEAKCCPPNASCGLVLIDYVVIRAELGVAGLASKGCVGMPAAAHWVVALVAQAARRKTAMVVLAGVAKQK